VKNLVMFKKCVHDLENVGYYYKEIRTKYRNEFDRINAYYRKRCKKCGKIMDVLVSSEQYMPQMYYGREPEMDRYVEHLKDKNFVMEVDLSN